MNEKNVCTPHVRRSVCMNVCTYIRMYLAIYSLVLLEAFPPQQVNIDVIDVISNKVDRVPMAAG